MCGNKFNSRNSKCFKKSKWCLVHHLSLERNKMPETKQLSSEIMKRTWKEGKFKIAFENAKKASEGSVWLVNKELGINFTAQIDSEKYKLAIMAGFVRGRLGWSAESRRKAGESRKGKDLSKQTGRIRIFNPLTNENKKIFPTEFEFWLNQGWLQGQHISEKERNKWKDKVYYNPLFSKALLGKRCIKNVETGRRKYINPLDDLPEGWIWTNQAPCKLKKVKKE